MTALARTPVYRTSDRELLGYVAHDTTGWQAQTIFGYTIERTTTREDAERVLREQGMTFLAGVWQYFDREDGEWCACVIKEVQEQRVTIRRTTNMGYQDPDNDKIVIIEHPTEQTLIKS